MEADYVNEEIGKKIRELRSRNGLTQQELADRSELTKGYISQLERGLVSPSVCTLLDLIECLGTNASDFFKRTAEPQVVFSEEGFFEKIDDSGNSIQWIVPSAQNNQMEPLLVSLQPHQTLEEDKPHPGEEFGYVMEGTVRIHLDSSTYDAAAGQSFYYSCDRFHRIENPGDTTAKLIWISTPPNF